MGELVVYTLEDRKKGILKYWVLNDIFESVGSRFFIDIHFGCIEYEACYVELTQ